MAEKKMYVVHTKRGYWIGAFAFKDQLRFAKIYTSLRFANEIVERIKRAYFDELSPKVLEVQLCLAQNAPTADVAPKSEVERLQEELTKAEADVRNYMKVAEYQQSLSVKRYHEIKRLEEDVDRLQDINNRQVENIRLAKQEVAREIFAEIEDYMLDFESITHTVNRTIGAATFALLKKKYMGDQT